MDLELKNKVAIVGGASKGLGRACAEVLAEEGMKVVMCSRTQADLDQAADAIRAKTKADILTFAGDLEKNEVIQKLVAAAAAKFGRIDVLISNSGGPPLAKSIDATEEQWAVAVQRSLFFFARMAREVLPHMRAQKSGRIINILASTIYQPIPNLALSGATRMGVVAYAKTHDLVASRKKSCGHLRTEHNKRFMARVKEMNRFKFKGHGDPYGWATIDDSLDELAGA
ncbi:MAG: SDR family NAD(P)-dependent oxidoreductase [Verrucomicrobiota bacterium]